MKIITTVLILSLLVLPACGEYKMPEISSNHPANSSAASVPLYPVADNLKIDEGSTPQVPPEFQRHQKQMKKRREQPDDSVQQLP